LINGRGGQGFGVATWNGSSGITSTAAQADPISYAVGYAENSDLPLGSYGTWGPSGSVQNLDATSILIRFTRGADTQLDSIVNDNDTTIVGAGYNQAGSGEWYLGDFDYSGMCGDDDVTVLGALYDPNAPSL
jgi:hypothetical protein